MIRPAHPRLSLRSMQGFGDNFYQRALVRNLVGQLDIWLDTPWPELYADLPVNLVQPVSRYRTQAKNIARFKDWGNYPIGSRPVLWHYSGFEGTMLQGLEKCVGMSLTEVDFSGPPVRPTERAIEYMIVRPATVRKEWPAASRNPYPEYIDIAARRAAKQGYEIVSVADVKPGEEWIVEPAPYAHTRYHRGELSTSELLGLVAGAKGIIGGVGWALPAALAYRVPMLCLFGGWGRDNAPARVLDPRLDCRRIVQAVPVEFCMCNDKDHNCVKTIDLEPYLEQYLRLVERAKTPVAPGTRHRVLSGNRPTL